MDTKQYSYKDNIKCRICYSLDDPISNLCDLISPCNCKGSMKYVHRSCLKIWRFKASRFNDLRNCDYCKSEYTIHEERVPYQIFVHIISFSLSIASLLCLRFLINTILRLFFIFYNDFSAKNNILYSIHRIRFGANTHCLMRPYQTICFLKISWIGAFIAGIGLYILLKKRNLFIILNYFFTVWRLCYFDFMVDRLYLGMISSIQAYRLMRDLCYYADILAYFYLNCVV